ncbi:hypothetical protein ACIPRI_09915 [Variovorax sp. LARHSF232]
MDYARPEDLRFLQQEVLQLPSALRALPAFSEVGDALMTQGLEEAGKFAEAIAPLNRDDDETGRRFAMHRIRDTRRAWIDGAHLLIYRTAQQLDVARHAQDAAQRKKAERWCSFMTPVLKAVRTPQAFQGGSEGDSEIQAIDLLVRKVLPDAGAAFAACLLELRDELDAAREHEAEAQRRMAQLRYLGTSIALAAKADPQLPYEVADDYLRVAMLTVLGWAWARIERAAPAGDARWAAPAQAFRRFVLPEFEMRLGMVKRACDSAAAR